jgi:hypothetical protein
MASEGSLGRYVAGETELWQLPATDVVALGMYGGFSPRLPAHLVDVEALAAVDAGKAGANVTAGARMGTYLAP